MRYRVQPGNIHGTVRIPGSKSHTVRAVLLAAMAEGESILRDPLDSGDTRSACICAEGFGATVTREPTRWRIRGTAGHPRADGQTIDVGNSGTTLYLALAMAALIRSGSIRFDGDAQIRRRSAANLLNALRDLGADFDAQDGCCPIVMRGGLRGGTTTIECPTSQYLTALLLACPLAPVDTHIDVPLLYERPYIDLTRRWMQELSLRQESDPADTHFHIPGRQSIPPFDKAIPADFSTASFFLCAPAITGDDLLLQGLDIEDPQGDKAVVDDLRAMGARITVEADGVRVHAGTRLRGATLDLNATPDALPILAVTAAFAEGETRLVNVPQARIKETDRIAVMAAELSKLGIRVRELDDGLVIEGGKMVGGEVCGHGDHRIVMAMAVAGLGAEGAVCVDTAEAAAVTVPDFPDLMRAVGARLDMPEDVA